jgi:hypothetical protein
MLHHPKQKRLILLSLFVVVVMGFFFNTIQAPVVNGLITMEQLYFMKYFGVCLDFGFSGIEPQSDKYLYGFL